jgi:hypothetical protein
MFRLGTRKPYYYSQLSHREQQGYQRLLTAFQDFSGRAELHDLGLRPEEAVRAFHYVNLDHPEIFWVKWECHYRYQTAPAGQTVTDLEVRYHLTRQQVKESQKAIDRVAEPIFRQLRQLPGGEWEKVKWLHDTIINWADYDYSEQGPGGKQECNHSIYGVFVNRMAVCEGYAEAMTWLLNRAGIDCITCLGGDHAWNVIRVEGEYSHFDVTWDDLGNDRAANGVCYRCFGLTTAEMDTLHGFSARFPIPACSSHRANYQLRLGLTAKNLEELHRQVRQAVRQRRKQLEVRILDRGLLTAAAKQRQSAPLWLPQDCQNQMKGYRLFQPDLASGWWRVELDYRT